MQKGTFIKSACLALAVAAAPVHAAIMEIGNINRDTISGLDWLDLTASQGLSMREVREQMGEGGAFQGYRYATMQEFDTLVTNFGYTAVNTNCKLGKFCDTEKDNHGLNGQGELIETMIRTLGDTQAAYYDRLIGDIAIQADGAGGSWGILGETHWLYDEWFHTARIWDNETKLNGADWGDHKDEVSSAMPFHMVRDTSAVWGYGSFLVKEVAPVPIPAAVWLFASGLLSLSVMRRFGRTTSK